MAATGGAGPTHPRAGQVHPGQVHPGWGHPDERAIRPADRFHGTNTGDPGGMITFLTDPQQTVLPESPVALVTIAAGTKYAEAFRRAALPGFAHYAERHGYDLIVVQCPLDEGPRARDRSIAWQKCLVLNQPWSAGYRRIVWMDADIVVNPAAPPIADACDETMVGACISEDRYSPAELHHITETEAGRNFSEQDALEHRAATQSRIYREDGLPVTFDRIVQTGVLVLAPQHHNRILLAAYDHDSRHRWYEQIALSRGILESGLLQRVSPRFNWLLGYTINRYFPPGRGLPRALFDLVVEGELRAAYFLHFCHDQAWAVFSAHPPDYARHPAG